MMEHTGYTVGTFCTAFLFVWPNYTAKSTFNNAVKAPCLRHHKSANAHDSIIHDRNAFGKVSIESITHINDCITAKIPLPEWEGDFLIIGYSLR